MKLVIDSREPLQCLYCFENCFSCIKSLHTHETNCANKKNSKFQFEYRKLPVSDYVIVKNVNGVDKVAPFLFERKTMNDFLLSAKTLNSNRLNKQFYFMQQFGEFQKFFLLEHQFNKVQPNNKKTQELYTAKLSELCFVHNFQQIVFYNYQEIVNFFIFFMKKTKSLDTDSWITFEMFVSYDKDFASMYYDKKILFNVITVVPGINKKIANFIVEEFGSIENLLVCYENCENKSLMLYNRVRYKNKIIVSQKISLYLYNYLFNIN